MSKFNTKMLTTGYLAYIPLHMLYSDVYQASAITVTHEMLYVIYEYVDYDNRIRVRKLLYFKSFYDG